MPNPITIGAVSYTHLDVYKRQVGLIDDLLQEQMSKAVKTWKETVSYTHLDVYKRQVLTHTGT